MKFIFVTTFLLMGACVCAQTLPASSGDAGEAPRYPMTMVCEGNPLFTNFPSPYYTNDGYGPMYTADPSARVWNINGKEVLYVYCSHDVEPPVGCDRMDAYHVFSTEDLRTWTDHGELFNSEQVNRKFGYVMPGFMWAPDCVYNPDDRLYYYFFPHAVDFAHNEWKIIVATSKDPATGFELKCEVEGTPSAIDPMVFVDTDGQPYLVMGGGGHVYGGKLLKSDWTRLDGPMKEMEGVPEFHEGAWVFKHNNLYYLTYPDDHSTPAGGNMMRYVTSTHPLGPWAEGGVYMYPHGETTAHGSVVEFKGQLYQFYHTGNYSGRGELRSVCFDPLVIRADGRLEVVHNWGTPKKGVAPKLTLSKTVKLEAEDYNEGGSHYGYFKRPGKGGMKVRTDRDGTYLQEMGYKEWARYSVKVKKEGSYAITCRLRPLEANSKFTVAVDGSFVRFEVPAGEVAGGWTEKELTNIYLTKGEHYLEFRSLAGSMDVDWLKINKGLAKIPGEIEAEDFDRGGEGVSFHWQNVHASGHSTYRPEVKFVGNNSAWGQHVGWSNDGNWLQYTVRVAQTGTYKLTTRVACANEKGGKFRYRLDGKELTDLLPFPSTGSWENFVEVAQTGVRLTAGVHQLRLYPYENTDVDKILFEWTGK